MTSGTRNILLVLFSLLVLAGASGFFIYHAIFSRPADPWRFLPNETRCVIRINSTYFFDHPEVGNNSVLEAFGAWDGPGSVVESILFLDSLVTESQTEAAHFPGQEVLLAIVPGSGGWHVIGLADASRRGVRRQWESLFERLQETPSLPDSPFRRYRTPEGGEYFAILRSGIIAFSGSQAGMEIMTRAMDQHRPPDGLLQASADRGPRVAASVLLQAGMLRTLLDGSDTADSPSQEQMEEASWYCFDLNFKQDKVFISGYLTRHPLLPSGNDSQTLPATSSPAIIPLPQAAEVIAYGNMRHTFHAQHDSSGRQEDTTITFRAFRVQMVDDPSPIFLLQAQDSAGESMHHALFKADTADEPVALRELLAALSPAEALPDQPISYQQSMDLIAAGWNPRTVQKVLNQARRPQLPAWLGLISTNIPDSVDVWGFRQLVPHGSLTSGSDAQPTHALIWALSSGERPLLTATLTSGGDASGSRRAPVPRTGAKIAKRPVALWDHRNKQYNVLVFDEEYIASLFSPQGELLWEYPLDGLPLGEVQLIDMFRNGKWQYLFNTRTTLYLLDLNGKDVEGYPKTLSVHATNGITAIDYDGRKDYRLFIAGEDRSVRNLDIRGQAVTGWDKPELGATVSMPVQHIAMYGKDYIIIPDDEGEVIMTDRKGDIRVRIKRSFRNAISSPFFLQRIHGETRIITTDDQGVVRALQKNGSVKTIRLGEPSADHRFIYAPFSSNRESDYIFLFTDRLVAYDKDGKVAFESALPFIPTDGPLVLSHASNHFLAVADSLTSSVLLFSPGSSEPAYTFRGRFTPLLLDLDQDLETEAVLVEEKQLNILRLQD